MGFWDRFRKGKEREEQPPLEPTALASQISPLLDELNQRIFWEHQESLLRESIDFVVPAVWGASKEGPLTPEQREIHQKVLPFVQKAFRIMSLTGLSEPQRFAVDFLLRGLIINRLTYTIMAAHNRGHNASRAAELLENLETVGTA